MLITAIEPRKSRRSALFLDGEFAMNIDTETLLQAGWRVGREVDDEELFALKQRSEMHRANEKALSLLEYRNHSKQELVEKIRRSTGSSAAQAAADRMEELGLIDDANFARNYARELFSRKGYASSRVFYELVRKGIEKELAQEIVEEFCPDPVEKIEEWIKRKYRGVFATEKERRRGIQALQRLGYSYEDIKKALQELGDRQILDEDEF